MSPKRRPDVAHPGTRYGRRALTSATLFVGVGAALLWFGHPLIAAASLLFATLMAYSGYTALRVTPAIELLSRAITETARGRFDRALEFVDAAEAQSRNGAIRSSAAFQRAVLAIGRAELRDALRYLDEVVKTPVSVSGGRRAQTNRAAINALRAFVCAALGETQAARQDIDAVLGDMHAGAGAVARARLAEAFLLRSDRAALSEHLRRHNDLMLEFLLPRERILLRALRRLSTTSLNVYRLTAERVVDVRDRKAWAEAVLPGAGDVVEEVAGPDAALEVLRGQRTAKETPVGNRAGTGSRGLLLWIGLVGVVLLILRLFQPSSSTTPATGHPASVATTLVWLLVLVVVLISFGVLLRRSRARSALQDAIRRLDVDRTDEAREQIAQIAASGDYLNAATAHLALARDDERRGELESSLAHAVAAREQIGARARHVSTDVLLLPAIRGHKARLLAALGREDEAMTELGVLERRHPTYAYLESLRRSVHLLAAMRRQDSAVAAQIARARENEYEVSLREEDLGELARLEAGEPFTRDRRERLRREIDENPELGRWIERIALHTVSKLQVE